MRRLTFNKKLFKVNNIDTITTHYLIASNIAFGHAFVAANPDGNYLFKFNNGNSKKMCKIFVKVTIRTRLVNVGSGLSYQTP